MTAAYETFERVIYSGVTYQYKGEWYHIPLYVLEEYSNDFFIEQLKEDIPHEEKKSYRLHKYLEQFQYCPGSDLKKDITEFKKLFKDQLATEFSAYKIYKKDNYA